LAKDISHEQREQAAGLKPALHPNLTTRKVITDRDFSRASALSLKNLRREMSENLNSLWLENVYHSPDATAVIEGEGGRHWSRASLQEAADHCFSAIPTDVSLARHRVALAEPNGPGWLAAFIGLLRAGAIVVPLDPAEPAEARVTTSLAVGVNWIWEAGRLRQLASHPPARRTDYCLVKLTSGSTGTPRALIFTHAQMIADGRQVCASMGIRPDDRNLGIIPFGHSYGLGNLIVPLLVQGTPIVTAASPLPNALAADCALWKPTVFPAVPMLLRALAQAGAAPAALASLRLVISAGAPLTPEIASAFAHHFGRRIHSFYGSSETGGISFDRTGEASLSGRSVGTPLDGVRLEFRRGGRFQVGSAAVRGAGHHMSPDRAKINELGELVLLGRTGRTAKIAGRRIDLGEVEKLLRATPGVRDAYAMLHPARADAIAAAVAGDVDAAKIRESLRARTALWKIPERLLVLPELPRNARGKIDRARLEELIADPNAGHIP
jgi:acyl-CoA synthetase (AMP-forming)/AMP-acid ligase II